MGLDMYLSKKTYVKQWEHIPKEEQFEVTVKRNGKVFDQIKVDRISYVEEQVMYWRKANHIHNWFVQNCQDSVDDCRSTCVSVKNLKNLYDACKKVMEFDAVSAPEDILPTTSGFFFGSTDYDEYYYQDIKDTIEFLEKEMDADGKFNGDYYYEASW
jgi:hypothetical protein